MVTINFSTFPPLPSFEPFAVQPRLSPSHFFCHIRPLGALACCHVVRDIIVFALATMSKMSFALATMSKRK